MVKSDLPLWLIAMPGISLLNIFPQRGFKEWNL
jgi:hypothetical protein